ncbi:MAG: HAD-IIA family hydrolase [candidate division Zixibacteria bacterium]
MSDVKKANRQSSSFDLTGKKCLVVDLDGTVYVGDRAIAGAVEFLESQQKQKEIFFLTNNSSRPPADYVDRLGRFGVRTDLEHILSPCRPLISYLADRDIKLAIVVGTDSFQAFLRSELPDLKITSSHTNCQAVVVAFDTELTYAKLRAAALALQDEKMQFIATHRDKVCPTEDGPIPDIGAILALLETATGRRPDKVFGKPDKAMLDNVLCRYTPGQIAVIGDRLYTDMALAENAKVDFVLVLSGESSRGDIEKQGRQPSLIINSIADLA